MSRSSLICVCLLAVMSTVAAKPDGRNRGDNDDYARSAAQRWADADNSDYDEPASENNGPETENEPSYEHAVDNDVKHYKSSDHRRQTVAKVIREQQNPQTLDEIYNGDSIKAAYNKSKAEDAPKQQVLLYIKFPFNFDMINPRNPNSLFVWRGSGAASASDAPLADNAAFKVVGAYNDKNRGEYGKNDLPYGQSGYLQLTTLPFANNGYQEGTLGPKQNYVVGANERILGRMKLACKIIDADKGPFNKTEVSRPDDDPRLASCRFQLANANATFPLCFFAVLNKSVWAVYIGQTFVSKRKVGMRERYDSIVDAGIELDKRQEVVNFYLNGYKVWTINSIGAPPPDDGINKIDYGSTGTPALTNLTEVSFTFGTAKCLDESDPYTADSTRLVRIQNTDSPYYSPSTTFYVPDITRSSIVWGQGAILKAYKLSIIKAESERLKRSDPLPADYGLSSNNN